MDSNQAHGQVVEVSPTLIVGVGGTGCRVAKMLRKLVEADVDIDDRPRVPFKFIGFDTDSRDMSNIKDAESPLHLTIDIAGRTEAIGVDGDRTDAGASFRTWLPRTKTGKLTIDPYHLASGQGAGGKRMMGRYAFKYHAPKHFDAVRRQIDELRNLCINPLSSWEGLEYVSSNSMEVFVVSSLAGGTGSGAFLDAVAMCHRLVEEAAPGFAKRIHLVLVLPSAFDNVIASVSKPTHRATAYACLKDLDNLLNGRVSKKFEFHGFQDVDIKGPFASDVFLVGRNGPAGTIPHLDELYKLIAIQLYGVIGTEYGIKYKSVGNNNPILGQMDADGGRALYSSFGMVGLDYDLVNWNFKRQSKLAARVIDRMLYGNAVTDSVPSLDALADDLVKDYKDGPSSFCVTRQIESLLSKYHVTFDDSVSKKDVERQLTTIIEVADEGRDKAEMDARIKRELPDWVRELRKSVANLADKYGIEVASGAVSSAIDKVIASSKLMADTTSPGDVTSSSEDAVNRIRSISTFKVLIQKDAAANEIDNIVISHNDKVMAELVRIAAVSIREIAIASQNGIVQNLSFLLSDLASRKDVLTRANARLQSLISDGKSTSSSALDSSLLIYDVAVELESEYTEHQVTSLYNTWLNNSDPQRNAHQSLGVIFDTLSSYVKVRGELKLIDELTNLAADQFTSDTPHILDLLYDGDEKVAENQLRRALRNLTPMSPTHLGIAKSSYGVTIAVVPPKNGQDHPQTAMFKDTFDAICPSFDLGQPNTVVFGSQPNRILISYTLMGWALNHAVFEPIADLERHFFSEIRRSSFLEVDTRWIGVNGLTKQTDGGRKQTWALGLAYGLIAQGKGSQYYNNLVTQHNRSIEVKGTLEEHEVDAEKILEACSNIRPVHEWFPEIMQFSTKQTLANKPFALARTFDGLESGNWHKRDLISKGRSNAMAAFENDLNEDYRDLEVGIHLIINAYFKSRGVGEILLELKEYRDRLTKASSSSMMDQDMIQQLETEVSMIDLTIEQISDDGQFELPTDI